MKRDLDPNVHVLRVDDLDVAMIQGPNMLHRGGRLFQQWIADQAAKAEQRARNLVHQNTPREAPRRQVYKCTQKPAGRNN